MTERKAIDWGTIEREYGASDVSVRKLARDHGITEGAVRDRAKRYGWERGSQEAEAVTPPAPTQHAKPEPADCVDAKMPREDSGLNERQRAFAREYVIDLNATAAAKRAGYSEDTAYSQGHDLLKKPEISRFIQRVMDDRAARTEVTADRIVRELAKIAFGDPRSVMEWGPDGVKLKASHELTDDEAALVSEVGETKSMTGGSIKAKLNDKQRALELLGKHLGMFVDRKEFTGEAGGPIKTESVVSIFELPANGRT